MYVKNIDKKQLVIEIQTILCFSSPCVSSRALIHLSGAVWLTLALTLTLSMYFLLPQYPCPKKKKKLEELL